MEQLDETPVFHVSRSVRQAESQDGAVLLDFRHGVRFVLNPIGLKMWNMLKESQSVEQITKSLVSEFQLPEQQIHQDVLEFIASLETQGLLFSAEQLAETGSVACRRTRNGRHFTWLNRLFAWAKRN
jgi:hypothetical protein